MRWLVILLAPLTLTMSTHAATVGKLSVGLGYEAKVSSDVNPDYTEVNSMGEVFVNAAFRPWSVLLEVDRYQSVSSEGNYSVQTTSVTPMIWGRYEPWSRWVVSPFAGLGVGWNFQDIQSRFGTASDERWADGGLQGGVALGVMSEFWQHLKMEAEVRLVKEELTDRPTGALVFRSGYTF